MATDACTGLIASRRASADACSLLRHTACTASVIINPALLVERSRVKCPLPDIELVTTAKKAQRIDCPVGPWRLQWTGSSTEKTLSDIANLLANRPNATERLRIMTLLAEEEAKFKLELSRRGDAPGGGRSPVNPATENPFKYDREEQRGGG